MRGMKIRSAALNDLDWLCAELKKFDEFYGSEIKLYGEDEYVRSALTGMIDNDILLVAEQKGKRVGFIGGRVSSHFYNPKIKTLAQIFWWVIPSARNSRAAVALLNEFVEYGRKFFDHITLNLSIKTGIGERSLSKRGFKLVDRTFLMEIA